MRFSMLKLVLTSSLNSSLVEEGGCSGAAHGSSSCRMKGHWEKFSSKVKTQCYSVYFAHPKFCFGLLGSPLQYLKTWKDKTANNLPHWAQLQVLLHCPLFCQTGYLNYAPSVTCSEHHHHPLRSWKRLISFSESKKIRFQLHVDLPRLYINIWTETILKNTYKNILGLGAAQTSIQSLPIELCSWEDGEIIRPLPKPLLEDSCIVGDWGGVFKS